MAASRTLRLCLEKVDFRPATQVTDDTSVLTLKRLVLEPLLTWRAGGRVGPGLFESWIHSDDGRAWEFRLRAGAAFHDGVPVAASHVVAFVDAIRAARDTFGMRWSYHRYLADACVTADETDSRVVRVLNPGPFADILDVFAEFYLCREDADGRPVLGTGRYRVAAFARDAGTASLEAVHGDGSAAWPRIEVSAVSSAAERLRRLRDGEADAALNLERLDEAGAPDFAPDLHWGRAATTLSVMCYLNCRSGVFASPAARMAANHAVDGAALAREVFSGLAMPAGAAVSPSHLGGGVFGGSPIAYDPARARRLLEGVDLSSPVTLRAPTYMPERAVATAHFVAAAFEAVGFRVVVEVEPDRPSYARQVGLEKRVGDLALFDSSPQSTFRVLDDKVSARRRAVWWQGYEDAEADRLIDEANHSVDDDARQAAYARCLQRLRENPPWLYLVHPVEVFACRLGVEGLSIDCRGVLDIA